MCILRSCEINMDKTSGSQDTVFPEHQSTLIQHPLNSVYSIWLRVPNKGSFLEFANSFVQISTFNTVEQFWSQYLHLKISNNQSSFDLCIFKQNILPMWEDKMNAEGGMLEIFSHTMDFALLFEKLTLYMIGEQLLPYDLVNGIYCRYRKTPSNRTVVQLWLKDYNEKLNEMIISSIKRSICSECGSKLRFKTMKNVDQLTYAREHTA
ncbi:hypothetical protein HZS_7199 [Henneguya salminicola]|uniref:Eukaryotic translation initiation factor 4E (Trinotate prediction) n=1 Tax=Henneguya salminicola TaxID=69463 RepID=A0A6G3MJA8_HENSL|nr:hypothetical protein HZS_7199 [Henneguya salminicola]